MCIRDRNNIPVNYAERIEVYKGVVPVGFGTDAIGGCLLYTSWEKAPKRPFRPLKIGYVVYSVDEIPTNR